MSNSFSSCLKPKHPFISSYLHWTGRATNSDERTVLHSIIELFKLIIQNALKSIQFSQRFVDPTIQLYNMLVFIALPFCKIKALNFFTSEHLGILNVGKVLSFKTFIKPLWIVRQDGKRKFLSYTNDYSVLNVWSRDFMSLAKTDLLLFVSGRMGVWKIKNIQFLHWNLEVDMTTNQQLSTG